MSAPASQDAPEPDLTKPVNVDISDYSDEFCAGFVAGQQSIVDEIRAGRVVLDAPEADDD